MYKHKQAKMINGQVQMIKMELMIETRMEKAAAMDTAPSTLTANFSIIPAIVHC